jgi:endoglucanase
MFRLRPPALLIPLVLALALTGAAPGKGSLPATGTAPSPAVGTGPVLVNQIGYAVGADKIATVVTPATEPLVWRLSPATGTTATAHGSGTAVATGTTRVYGTDAASGDHLHQADFSRVSARGSYRLTVSGVGTSVPFTITGDPLYPRLGREAMRYFYFHRMGSPVLARHVRIAAHAHDALHPGDNSLACYRDWSGTEHLDVAGSWADAGDFGVYPVNHAIAAWTLMNLYERLPAAYGDGSLAIPERDNGRPDILDEVAYGSRFSPCSRWRATCRPPTSHGCAETCARSPAGWSPYSGPRDIRRRSPAPAPTPGAPTPLSPTAWCCWASRTRSPATCAIRAPCTAAWTT